MSKPIILVAIILFSLTIGLVIGIIISDKSAVKLFDITAKVIENAILSGYSIHIDSMEISKKDRERFGLYKKRSARIRVIDVARDWGFDKFAETGCGYFENISSPGLGGVTHIITELKLMLDEARIKADEKEIGSEDQLPLR